MRKTIAHDILGYFFGVGMIFAVAFSFSYGFVVFDAHAQEEDAQLQKLIDQAGEYNISLSGDETKNDLEDLIDDYEDAQDEKKDLKKDLKKAEKKKDALQQTLSVQYSELSKNRNLIAQTESQVQAKEQLISGQEKEIKRLQSEQDLQRVILGATLRQLYYVQSDSKTTNIFEDNVTAQFLAMEDQLDALRAESRLTFDTLTRLHETEQTKKEEAEQAKAEKEKLLAQQKKQEQAVAAAAASTRIAVTRAEATISELNSHLSSIEASLSALLGKSFDTNDIVDAAKFASKKTGVRKDFILGMLTQETSLGRFTGGCTYKKSRMGSANEKIFKRVAKELGYNYKKKKVSCPLSYGIGGAMGVAQFMPTTWVNYESTVSQYTGHHPPDPWSLTDGVMAMAVKLKWDGGDKKSGENTAARRYYCGSNLGRSVCANYASSVLYWAENYKRLLK